MKNSDIERINKLIKVIDNIDITRMTDGELILFKNTVYMALLDIRDDDYGFTFDDYYGAAMLGYCRARNKFDYEKYDLSDDELQKIELGGLTPAEVRTLVKAQITDVDLSLASEVACFSNGNPRLVLNLLALCRTVAELRAAILPDKPNTVSGIVAQKLELFLKTAKKTYSRTEQNKILLLFDSLAVLPPAIPVEVLAHASSLEK